MRNKYGGNCYFCGKYVSKGAGHFERTNNGWRIIHADCVFVQRDQKLAENAIAADAAREMFGDDPYLIDKFMND